MKLKQKQILVIVVLVGVLFLFNKDKKEARWDGPNLVTDPYIDNWDFSDNLKVLPTGWGNEYDYTPHGTNRSLTRIEHTYRSAPYSAGVIDKGFDGTSGICTDWCGWRSEKVGVTPGELINGRFFYYPVEFNQHNGVKGHGVRAQMVFYDSGGNFMETTPVKYMLPEDFETQEWKQMDFMADAPANSATAALNFYVPSNERRKVFISTTFYVDDFWIETMNWSQCHDLDGDGYSDPATRLCPDDKRQWDCDDTNPNINFWTEEQCDNGVDDDCDGYIDEGCDVLELINSGTTQDFVDAFDYLYSYSRGGYVNDSDINYTAWEGTLVIQALIRMYYVNEDTKYIEYARNNIRDLINRAFDSDGNGLMDFYRVGSGYDRDEITVSGKFMQVFTLFSYVVKKEKLVEYYPDADNFVDFVETNFIPLFDGRWQECGDMGFWSQSLQDHTYPYESSDPQWSAVINQIAHTASAHVFLYLYTGEEKYRNKVTRYANKMRSHFFQMNDGQTGISYYRWNYLNKAGCQTDDDEYICSFDCQAEDDMPWRCDVDPTEDPFKCAGAFQHHYAGYDIQPILDTYDAGLVYTSQDIQYIANALKDAFLFPAEVNGFNTTVAYYSSDMSEYSVSFIKHYASIAQLNHWFRMGHYDPEANEKLLDALAFMVATVVRENSPRPYPYDCILERRAPRYNPLGYYGEYCIPIPSYKVNPGLLMGPIAYHLTEPIELEMVTDDCSSDSDCPTLECYTNKCIGNRCEYTMHEDETPCDRGVCRGGQCFQTCGNGELDPNEDCDGELLGDANCMSEGYSAGYLGCSDECTFDYSDCKGATHTGSGTDMSIMFIILGAVLLIFLSGGGVR